MNVIVEPDSAAGWFTLAGVVLGSGLTGSLSWMRTRHDDRKEHQRETNRAADELLTIFNGGGYGHWRA